MVFFSDELLMVFEILPSHNRSGGFIYDKTLFNTKMRVSVYNGTRVISCTLSNCTFSNCTLSNAMNTQTEETAHSQTQ